MQSTEIFEKKQELETMLSETIEDQLQSFKINE